MKTKQFSSFYRLRRLFAKWHKRYDQMSSSNNDVPVFESGAMCMYMCVFPLFVLEFHQCFLFVFRHDAYLFICACHEFRGSFGAWAISYGLISFILGKKFLLFFISVRDGPEEDTETRQRPKKTKNYLTFAKHTQQI